MNLNNYYFHFISGYTNIEKNTPNTLLKLSSILRNGAILSRENQIKFLNASFHNNGCNWNNDEFISICKIGSDLDGYIAHDENAYELFCGDHAISIVLSDELLYHVIKRHHYWHMQGEYQIKDAISKDHFVGVGVQFKSYALSNKEDIENDFRLYNDVKNIVIENGFNFPILALNNGDLAIDYINNVKTKKLSIK